MSYYHRGVPVVYTDGACSGNQFQPGARAGIGVFWGPNNSNNVSERYQGRQTNNSAEINAACVAIQQAIDMGYQELIIRTDCQFMINAVNDWIPQWQRNGWTNLRGHPVANRADFQRLLSLMEEIQVSFEKVEAHAGDYGNGMADQLAKQGCNGALARSAY